jgi:hypothetical protein
MVLDLPGGTLLAGVKKLSCFWKKERYQENLVLPTEPRQKPGKTH